MLTQLLKKGQVVHEECRALELGELFLIVERDLKDSEVEELSEDWQFGIIYNAALKLCTILIRFHGFRVRGNGFHLNTIQLSHLLLGAKNFDIATYLDSCRRKRNLLEYDCTGGVSQEEVKELREFVLELRQRVIKHMSER